MIKTPLKHLSQIESGKSFRGRVEDNAEGDCWVLQMKDISKGAIHIVGSPQRIALDQVSEHQLLQKGDILFLAKGNSNFAYVYNQDQNAIAVSFFFVIRVDKVKLDPGYLAWFINSTDGQSYLQEKRVGASVGNILKKDLEDMPIPMPSLQVQSMIAGLSLKKMEEKLLSDLIFEKTELFINESLKKHLNQGA